MITEVKNFKRQRIFDIYNSKANPFLIVNTRIDVTNVVNYCKIHKNNYAVMGYIIGFTVNDMECFKYRLINNKIYKCDKLNVNFTQMLDDDGIGFFTCKMEKNFDSFLESYKKNEKEFFLTHKSTIEDEECEVWLSCVPWFTFNSLVTPFDKSVTIPQIIWGKYVSENGKWYTDLMILIHHGFADGSHVGEFLNKLNKNIEKFDEIIKEAR